MQPNETNHLIDAVVRQTMILIAQLATTGGRRAPLAHLANQVFLGLVTELQNQGINQKVTADMFGLALRTYQRKRQRLAESATDHGRSLWEAVLNHVAEHGRPTRAELLTRFRWDEESSVRGVLNDLVETGLIAKQGRGARTSYSLAEREALDETEEVDPHEVTATLVWIAVYRNGPATLAQMIDVLSMDETVLTSALNLLLGDGRIEACSGEDGETIYRCDSYLIPQGSDAGWAAAVFDHYQALVGAVCAKLQSREQRSVPGEYLGGSTFNFDVWEGHPLEAEVLGLLAEERGRAHALRQRVDAYNAGVEMPPHRKRTVFYLGQNVLYDGEEANE